MGTLESWRDEASQVAVHLAIQHAFEKVMMAAKRQFGFCESSVGSRMMLMSPPTDDTLVFKDRVSRTSFIYNTKSDCIEIPTRISDRWAEIWHEFTVEASPPTHGPYTDEERNLFRTHRLYGIGLALAQEYLLATDEHAMAVATIRLTDVARKIELDIKQVCGFTFMVDEANWALGKPKT